MLSSVAWIMLASTVPSTTSRSASVHRALHADAAADDQRAALRRLTRRGWAGMPGRGGGHAGGAGAGPAGGIGAGWAGGRGTGCGP